MYPEVLREHIQNARDPETLSECSYDPNRRNHEIFIVEEGVKDCFYIGRNPKKHELHLKKENGITVAHEVVI
jgi:hypothetical protein